MLVVGRQVENVLPKMDPECSGSLVLDLNWQEDVGDAILLLDGGSLGLE